MGVKRETRIDTLIRLVRGFKQVSKKGECYEVLNGYDINDFIINKETYLVIDDETDDIDYPEQIEILNKKVSEKDAF